MPRRKTKRISFEWKGVEIFLPKIAISSDLRRVADDFYLERKLKQASTKMDQDWDPSWSDEEEDLKDSANGSPHKDCKTGLHTGEAEVASMDKVNTGSVWGKLGNRTTPKKAKKPPENLQDGNLFRRKYYNKEELFKNLTGRQLKEDREEGQLPMEDMSKCQTDTTKTQRSLREKFKAFDVELNSNELKCKECGKQFTKKIHLTLHQKIHASMDKPVPSKDIRGKYPCTSCDSHFDRNDDLISHVEKEHSSSWKTGTNEQGIEFKCDKCGRCFERSNQLKFHRKLCKGGSSNTSDEKVKLEPINQKTSANEQVEEFKCEKCGRHFERINQLKLHRNLCKSTANSKSAEKPTQHTIVQKTSTDEQVDGFQCEKCDRTFERINQLKFHRNLCKASSNPKPAEKTAQLIIEQKTGTDEQVQQFTCEKCNRCFERINQLKFHGKLCKGTSNFKSVEKASLPPIKQAHDDTLETSDSLSMSSRTTNETCSSSILKFSCKDCGREFKYQRHLTLHMSVHSKVCDRCSLTFHDAEFEEHLESCSVVSKVTRSSSSAVSRRDISSSLQCATCGKTFSTQVVLNQHLLLHEYSIEYFIDSDLCYLDSILPFPCKHDGCESRFSDQFDLDFHRSKKHNIKSYSNPTYYHIEDSQLPPLNPYVLLTREIKEPADDALGKYAEMSRSEHRKPRLFNKRVKKRRGRGRQPRLDIPFQSVYTCETCDKKFWKRNLYIIHIGVHKREEKYTCTMCERKFQSESLLKAHVELHSDPSYVSRAGRRFRDDIPIQSVYTCEQCQKKFNKRNYYIIHLSQHKREEKFACKICERKFQSESLFKTHMDLHSDPNYVSSPGRRYRTDIPHQSVYTCEECGEKFNKRNLYLLHLLLEKYKCTLCDRKFQSESLLEAHLKRHEDPSYVPGTLGRGRYRSDIPIQSLYTCETCQKTFEDRTLFLSHLSLHKREEKFKCHICHCKYPTSLLYQLHMKRHADPSFRPRRARGSIPIQDVYNCEKCERSFTNRQRYICHLYYHRKARTDNLLGPGKRRPRRSDIPIQDVYNCEQCNNREFTDRIKYIMHLYNHNKQNEQQSGGKLRKQRRSDIPVQDIYYCEQCDFRKSFTDRNKYILHLRNHGLEKRHKCDGCLKLFKTTNARDLHAEKYCKRIPCKYKCDRCSDRFHNKITLTRHFQRHHSKVLTTQEPEIEYPCNQCSQTFNTTFGLTRHHQIYHPATDVALEHDQPNFTNDHDDIHQDYSSQSWSPDRDDDDDHMVAASLFCEAELSEEPSQEKHNGPAKAQKKKLPRSGTLCQCGVNKKYKSQKFCHSLRCPCVQAGSRCSKNCDCDKACLNSTEMEVEQQQKFKEGKETMMQEIQDEYDNASTPVVIGYTDDTIDDRYPEPVTHTSSLGYNKLIPTSEFITVDDGEDESMRQLSMEGYVEGADDMDPLGDPLADQVQQPESTRTAQAFKIDNSRFAGNPPPARTPDMHVSTPPIPAAFKTSLTTNSNSASVPTPHNKQVDASLDSFNQSANLRCQLCKKNFKIVPTFISHILLHDVEKSHLTCPICSKEFGNQIMVYVEHLDSHNKGINLQCTKCSSKFKSYKDMEKHLQVHHFRPMECGLCTIKFPNSQLMMSHWSKVHPTCQCGLCNVKFFSYDDLTFHMKSLHSPYDCLRCNERFENLEGLLKHFVQRHSAKASSHNMPRTSQGSLKCSYCEDTFSNGEDLNEHLSNHLSTRHQQYPVNHHQCGQCNATFTTPEDLHDHLAQHIMGSSTSSTNPQPHTYASHSSNNTNMYATSATEIKVDDDVVNDNMQAVEVLTCPKLTCGKTFHNRTGWRSHLSSHNLLLCSACDSSFETKDELANHLQANSCQVYCCELCDRNFQAKKYLAQHKKFVHDGERRSAGANRNSNASTPVNYQLVTGEAAKTGGIMHTNPFPVIVASTSLARNSSATFTVNGGRAFPSTSRTQTQEEIEEIVLD